MGAFRLLRDKRQVLNSGCLGRANSARIVGVSDLYREIHPSARLTEYVECYWSSKVPSRIVDHAVLPDGCVDILFSRKCGEPVSLSVVGLMTRPLARTAEAGEEFFGVRFRPGMASAFVHDAPLLTDRVEPLMTFWGSTARLLYERLAESSGPQEMAELVENCLNPARLIDPCGLALLQLRAGSNLPLTQIAVTAGFSERHFRRVCADRTGICPKRLRRILRFRYAVDRLRASIPGGAQPSWAHFAVACGYYDQAHLIREFREFAGCTPGRFVQSDKAGQRLESDAYEREKTK